MFIVTKGCGEMSKKKLQSIDICHFQHDLIQWYEANKRELPWRKNRDPYKVWVSEVMLQQTRVDTVIPYFEHFMDLYPTLHHLAEADEEDVLKVWEGLGYYSRARNLHTAVKEVVEKYDGVIPNDPKKLIALKGIGPYTKGAIMSIAFNEAEPAVDGNVMRVLSRVLFLTDNVSEYRTRKKIEDYARELISEDEPASFNQGLMELGALICTPKKPKCSECPIQIYCKAYHSGIPEQLPVKSKSKKQSRIPYVVLSIRNEANEYLIEKRPATGLLANLWQFPMVPITEIGFEHIVPWIKAEYGINIFLREKIGSFEHVFSHLIWDLSVYTAVTSEEPDEDDHIQFVHYDQLSSYPFPVPHLKIKEEMIKFY